MISRSDAPVHIYAVVDEDGEIVTSDTDEAPMYEVADPRSDLRVVTYAKA